MRIGYHGRDRRRRGELAKIGGLGLTGRGPALTPASGEKDREKNHRTDMSETDPHRKDYSYKFT